MKFRGNMEIVCTVLPSRTEELMSEPERLSLFYYYGAGLSFGIVSLPWIFRVCPRPNVRIRPSRGKGQFARNAVVQAVFVHAIKE